MKVLLLIAAGLCAQAQPAFDVASVKPNPHPLGPDYRTGLVVRPGRLVGANVTLKELIVEAYHVQPFQVSGGPAWLNADEFEIDARAGGAATRDQMRPMLQALLAERFHLGLRRETKDVRAFVLGVDSGGPKIKAKEGGFSTDALAARISVQLSIAVSDDPTRPSRATGAPAPVLNETGLDGTYDLNFNIRPEPNGDMFTLWQRKVREEFGLKLEARRTPVEMLVVERTDRVPAAN